MTHANVKGYVNVGEKNVLRWHRVYIDKRIKLYQQHIIINFNINENLRRMKFFKGQLRRTVSALMHRIV